MTHADLAILIAFVATYATACTTYAVGRDATIDGSVIVTHSDDGAGDTDSRIAYVPAADHPKGALRPIWPEAETYPRFVGTRRGATYAALPGQKDTEPIGFIPQVEHTFAFYEAGAPPAASLPNSSPMLAYRQPIPTDAAAPADPFLSRRLRLSERMLPLVR